MNNIPYLTILGTSLGPYSQNNLFGGTLAWCLSKSFGLAKQGMKYNCCKQELYSQTKTQPSKRLLLFKSQEIDVTMEITWKLQTNICHYDVNRSYCDVNRSYCDPTLLIVMPLHKATLNMEICDFPSQKYH